MAQKECKKCGEKLENSANFCPKCGGNEFNEITAEVVKKFPTKKLNKKKTMIVIGVAILVAIFIGVFSKNDENNSKIGNSTTTQSATDGYIENDNYFDDAGYVEPDINFDFSTVNVGDSVYFGHYEQDGDFDNGTESIEWIVLEKRQDKMLLISKKILESSVYSYSEFGSEWKYSNVNKKLVKEIFADAFTAEEKEFLTSDKIISEDGSFTPDEEVFTLCSEEVTKYSEIIDELYECYPTEYAKKVGINVVDNENVKGSSFWWMRRNVAYGETMSPTGMPYIGVRSVETEHGIRPTIWLESDAPITTEPTANKEIVLTGDEGAEAGLRNFTHRLISQELISEDLISCMNAPMIWFCYDEFGLCDDEDFSFENHSTEFLFKKLKEDYKESNNTIPQLEYIKFNEVDVDAFYSYEILEEIKSLGGDEVYRHTLDEKNNVEKVWISSSYVIRDYDGELTEYDYDSEEPYTFNIFVFLIKGEYYWCFFEGI